LELFRIDLEPDMTEVESAWAEVIRLKPYIIAYLVMPGDLRI